VRLRLVLVALLLAAAGCGGGGGGGASSRSSAPTSIRLESPAFRAGGQIPRRFTCDGRDLSLPLRWSGVPAHARRLALVVQDPDAGGFVHWLVVSIPARARGFREGGAPAGAVQLTNSFKKNDWSGPCPPRGSKPHRYVFSLYAVGSSRAPSEPAGLARAAVARGSLVARYARGGGSP